MSSADIFQHYFFQKCSLGYNIRVPNSLDPGQARHSVGPDLDPNCLQRSSTDNKICSKQAKNKTIIVFRENIPAHKLKFVTLKIRPRSGSGSKLFFSLMVFIKAFFFEKDNTEKKLAGFKKA